MSKASSTATNLDGPAAPDLMLDERQGGEHGNNGDGKNENKETTVPKEKGGVSVTELIAKRGGKQESPSPDGTSDGTPGAPVPAASIDDLPQDLSQFKDKTKDGAGNVTKNDTKAGGEFVAQAPAQVDGAADSTSGVKEATVAKTVQAEKNTDKAADQADKREGEAGKAKPPNVPTATGGGNSTANDDDSLAKALQSEASPAPQEHSESFKAAMKEMADEDGQDSQAHHELYGGKPVIVVHKNHGARSALLWVIAVLFCVGLALVIVNFLLDAGVITIDYDVPHTDLIAN